MSLADVIHLQPQGGNGEAASLHHDTFVWGYLPLAFVDPSTNCKAAVLVLVRPGISPVLTISGRHSPIRHLGRRLVGDQ